ncbi:MAG TPA: biotin/lipoyl-containing protein [Gemmatimonadales bacterium]
MGLATDPGCWPAAASPCDEPATNRPPDDSVPGRTAEGPMKYGVTVGDRAFEVEVVGERLMLDGRQLEALIDAIPGTPLRRLVMNGRARTLALVREPGGWMVQCGGERWLVRVVDERTRQLEALTSQRAGGSQGSLVRAPMPGLVLRLEVEVGQPVDVGTGLVVLEAMKMENEIRATGPGIVTAVRVVAGQAVEKGVVLVEIGAHLDSQAGSD